MNVMVTVADVLSLLSLEVVVAIAVVVVAVVIIVKAICHFYDK